MRREEREALVNLLTAYHSAMVAQIAEVIAASQGRPAVQEEMRKEAQKRIAEIEIAAHGFVDSIGV